MSEIIEVTTEEQLELARTLFGEYRAQLPVEYCRPRSDAEIAGLPGEYAPPKGKLLLARVVGQPVGCVGLRPFRAKALARSSGFTCGRDFGRQSRQNSSWTAFYWTRAILGYSFLRLRHASSYHASRAGALSKAGLSGSHA